MVRARACVRPALAAAEPQRRKSRSYTSAALSWSAAQCLLACNPGFPESSGL